MAEPTRNWWTAETDVVKADGSTSTWRKLPYLLSPLLLPVIAAALITASIAPAGYAASAAQSQLVEAYNDIPVDFSDPPMPQRSVMLSSDGQVIARITSYNRIVVDVNKVSPYVTQALLATEDNRYYQHKGVDVLGTLRAAGNMVRGGQVQGGSTLTQQYVKNANLLAAELSGDDTAMKAAVEQTLWRKLVEAKTALALERQLSKDEILQRYLNIVNFGAGAYGIEAAAQRYFSTTSKKLNPGQAATLVGILKAPSVYSPLVNRERSRERRNVVLTLMLNNNYITQKEYDTYTRQGLKLKPTQPETGCSSAKPQWGLYCAAALDQLLNDPTFGKTETERAQLLTSGGLVIRTHLDTEATQQAIASMQTYVPADAKAALTAVVVQPGTGQVPVLAMSRNYGTENNATVVPLATRAWASPGSTFKAFTAAAALEQGISVDTVLPGGSFYTSDIFDNPQSGGFNNYDQSYASNVTIRDAMRRSLNTAFVQLQELTSTQAVANAARRMGVTSLPATGNNQVRDSEGSLTLGAREVSTLDMAAAYSTIAAGGTYCRPQFISHVRTPTGKYVTEPECTAALDPSVAATLTDLLTEPVSAGGTGTSAALPDRPVAGKTGTAISNSALWFAGFTPSWAAAVALADPRGPLAYPVNGYSSNIPDVVFRDVMTQLHDGSDPQPLPVVDPLYLLAPGAPNVTPTLPNVVGLPVDTATRILAPWKIQLDRKTVQGNIASQTVVSMSPSSGAELPYDDTVTIAVAD